MLKEHKQQPRTYRKYDIENCSVIYAPNIDERNCTNRNFIFRLIQILMLQSRK